MCRVTLARAAAPGAKCRRICDGNWPISACSESNGDIVDEARLAEARRGQQAQRLGLPVVDGRQRLGVAKLEVVDGKSATDKSLSAAGERRFCCRTGP